MIKARSLEIRYWLKEQIIISNSSRKEHQVKIFQNKLSGSWLFASSLKDLELNRDFNGEDYEYEDEAKLVIFPDHFEIPLPNIEELPALVSESVLPLQCTLMVPWVATPSVL